MTAPSTRDKSPCRVCGDKSIGFNFGVLSCMACKAFFRRNAVRLGSYEFVCPKDGDCPITHVHRRLCNCCRLAKCFRVGMRKDLILSDAAKQARRVRAAQNRVRQEQMRSPGKASPSSLPCTQALMCRPYSGLSADDRTVLQNIFNAYESTCMASKQSNYPEFPLRPHTDLFTYMNEYSSTHKMLIEYFKVIPEFQNFVIEDKIYLIRSQFGLINNINEAIVHPGVSSNLVVSLINIFGARLADRLLRSIRRIESFAVDPIVLKLLLIIVAFSSGNHRYRNGANVGDVCHNSLTIFAAQNAYIEKLWKYLRSRMSNELEAVKYFNKLIQFLLDLLEVHMLVDGYISDLSNEIEQMEPLMRSMWPSSTTTPVEA